MRTNIVIDDGLMDEAMTLSQIKTKKGVVETGFKLLVQIKKQEKIKSLRGKLKWEGVGEGDDGGRLTEGSGRITSDK
jgi:Arc/MetJ family transcription regulator